MSWRYAYLPGSYRSKSESKKMTNYEQTTGRQLQRILHYSVTPCRPLPGFRRSTDAHFDVDCDEVYPRLYIGDANAAKNKQYLKIMGFTHVLNAAEGTRFGQVDTGHSYYRDMQNMSRKTNFRYMGFPLIDQPSSDISRYFYIAAKFIENGINSGGKVLVHCMVGMSRSATCVLAYLMICKRMSATEAIRTVRMHRDIRPNDGFIQQLADLDNELRRERDRCY
ncbi:dual specificity protein phosphatase 13B isoform X1 [Culicoides brevitarsis]|uniref:dual specificity protein phosphatase 13B isoform X1 n=2 Tax=Culicoides brevitarsis TaxID=469753 RepID=UPI00307B2679